MKIALISPRGAFLSKNHNFRKFWENTQESSGYRFFWSGFGLGLLTIAALLPKHIEVELIDENFEDINFSKGYDLVAISAITQQAVRAYEIANIFRRQGVKIVLGGMHPTVMPNEAKKYADSVLIGEGEKIWVKFINDFLKNNIEPFYNNNTTIDLTKLPIPRFELLNPNYYKMIWIQTSRGCPIDCDFCAASKIFGSKIRHKRIIQVINEIKYIKTIWKHAHINFADDNMFIDKTYASELIEALAPLKIRWTAQTDISVARHDSLLRKIRQSGCEILFIGFESLSKKNLDRIDKHHWKVRYLDYYSQTIQKIQSNGIGIMGAFIIGFDEDTVDIFKQTTNFIIQNNLFGAQITILTPLPGTRLREYFEKEGRVISNNTWDSYTGFDVNFIPKGMSVQTLQNSLLEMYRRIYSPEVRLQKVKFFKNIYKNLCNTQNAYQ